MVKNVSYIEISLVLYFSDIYSKAGFLKVFSSRYGDFILNSFNFSSIYIFSKGLFIKNKLFIYKINISQLFLFKKIKLALNNFLMSKNI